MKTKKRLILHALLFLAGLLFYSNPIQSQDYQLIDSLIKTLPNLSGEEEVNQLQEIAYAYPNHDTARIYAKLAVEKSEAIDYHKGVARAWGFIGKRYGRQRKSEEALAAFEKALEAVNQTNAPELKGKILGDHGYTLSLKGEMEKALEMFLEALRVAEATGDKKMIARSQFELGDFYRLQHDTQKAIQYLEKALVYHKAEKDLNGTARIIYTIGITYKVGKPAETMHHKGIPYLESLLEPPYLETLSSATLGRIYTSLGSMYSFEEDYEKAKPLLLKSLEIKKQNKDTFSMGFSLNELATFYKDQNQFAKSIIYAEQVRNIVEKKDDIFLKYDNYKNLADAYAGIKDYEKSYEYLSKNIKLRDSVLNQEKVLANAEMEKKYQNAIAQEKIARQDLELSKQKSRSYFLISILLIGGLLTFLWMRTRLKYKAREAEQLEQLSKTKNRLFTNISHELLTPLTLLVNPLRNLKSEINNENNVTIPAHQLNLMTRNGERLDRLIRQIMDLSKLDEGQLQLQAKEQDLAAFASNIVDSFIPMARGQNVELKFFSTETPLNLFFDSAKMENILINLISNALKFSKENGSVTVLLSEKNKQAEIQIQDTGIGIEASRLPFIFDRFYQIDDSDIREKEGMGIGLAIVKEMTNLHQGQINVTSSPNEGTCFVLNFPLGSAHLSSSEINHELQYKPRKVQLLGERKMNPPTQKNENLPLILVVEDNRDLLTYLCEQLETKYKVLPASNANKGLELAFEHIPDLILSDVMMPKMDGFEFCQQLKSDERTSHIPIVLLTAKADRDQVLIGLEKGADDYMTKPFDQDVLFTKINNLIEQRRKLRLLFAEKITVQPSEVKVQSIDDKFLLRLLEVIEIHLGNPDFGINELSREIGMSRSQLYRKLKALTNESPTVFLRTVRLERAHQLLLSSAGNATEIAYQVGFSNPNYFFKCFKDQFGKTPKEAIEKAIFENQNHSSTNGAS